MNLTHNDDKAKLLAYVERINEKQDLISISLSFKVMADEQRFCFYINGKVCLKDSIDEAICFLDGLNVFADEFITIYNPY